jgi:hypothetical protein
MQRFASAISGFAIAFAVVDKPLPLATTMPWDSGANGLSTKPAGILLGGRGE